MSNFAAEDMNTENDLLTELDVLVSISSVEFESLSFTGRLRLSVGQIFPIGDIVK